MTNSRKSSRAARGLIAVFVSMGALAGAGSAPAAPHCDARVTFDDLTEGDKFSGDSVPEGSLHVSEDGIDVRSARIRYGGGKDGYDAGSVAAAPVSPCGFGGGLVFRPENFGLTFDLSKLDFTVTEVHVRWLDNGGIENLRVNGAETFIGDLDDAPADIAPGIRCSVRSHDCGYGEKGGITLIGPVQRFTLAGQEFALDNICVMGHRPGTLEPAILSLDGDEPDLGDDKAAAVAGTSWGALKAQYR